MVEITSSRSEEVAQNQLCNCEGLYKQIQKCQGARFFITWCGGQQPQAEQYGFERSRIAKHSLPTLRP